MSHWRPKPGASEVYSILVPCAITAGGKHVVKLRLRSQDDRVTFEGACDRRAAAAHDRLVRHQLDGGHYLDLSCAKWIVALANAVAAHNTFNLAGGDLSRCKTCDAYVPTWFSECPFQAQDSGFIHRLDRSDLPFWERIVRSGRLRS